MLYKFFRFFLFLLPPETAHNFTLWLMKILACSKLAYFVKNNRKKPTTVNGIHFQNPIGIAAGFDKTGTCIEATEALGFGFIEVGGFTPKPQIGNPKPRVFRILKLNALINRMGLNNAGVDSAVKQIRTQRYSIPIGINLGKNSDSSFEQGIEDYLYGFDKMYELADYFSVNISCPNVPDHTLFWYGENFKTLLETLKQKQLSIKEQKGKYVPLFVKISPDLTEEDLLNFCKVFNDSGLDGVIACNTSPLYRPADIANEVLKEKGGLSGPPIFSKMLTILKLLKLHLKANTTLIAVGGIDSAEAALQCYHAGADLIQIYTGLIYEGPGLVSKILKDI